MQQSPWWGTCTSSGIRNVGCHQQFWIRSRGVLPGSENLLSPQKKNSSTQPQRRTQTAVLKAWSLDRGISTIQVLVRSANSRMPVTPTLNKVKSATWKRGRRKHSYCPSLNVPAQCLPSENLAIILS